MRKIIFSLLFIISLSEGYAEPIEWIPVASSGNTVIERTLQKKIVQIKISTHEIDIGKANDAPPSKRKNNCTYTRYPCSLVDVVEISVDGKEIFVPRSVFSDRSDLFRVTIETKKNLFVLKLKGGDASESYLVEVMFDGNRILKRKLFDAIQPEEVLQVTNYYLPTPIE